MICVYGYSLPARYLGGLRNTGWYEIFRLTIIDSRMTKCPHCQSERFSTTRAYQRHVKTCYKNPHVKYIQCEDCERKFARRDNYLHHRALHSNWIGHRNPTGVDPVTVQKYDNGEIPFDDIFTIKSKRETCAHSDKLVARECLFQVDMTKTAFQLAHAGKLYGMMEKLFEHIAEVTNFRQPNVLVQIVFESKGLEYPLVTGAHRGTDVKPLEMFQRFDAVSQSRKLFEFEEDNPEIIITVFQMPMPTYGGGKKNKYPK